MSVLDRSMFQNYAKGGLVVPEGFGDYSTQQRDYHAKEFLRQKGVPVTPATLDTALRKYDIAYEQMQGEVNDPMDAIDLPPMLPDEGERLATTYPAVEAPPRPEMTPVNQENPKDLPQFYQPEAGGEAIELNAWTPEELPVESPADVTQFDQLEAGGEATELKKPLAIAIDAFGKDIPTNIKEEILQTVDESPEVRKAFAEELGISLKDPYDTWAYVRDMSAGLLASSNPTFLGAWGEAALLSNKNRREAGKENRLLKAKLGILNWENKQKVKAAKLKTQSAMDIASMKEPAAKKKPWQISRSKFVNEQGQTVESYETNVQPSSELNSTQLGNGNWLVTHTTQDNTVVRKRRVDLSDAISKTVSSADTFDKMIKLAGYNTVFQGKQLYDFATNPEYADARKDLSKANREVMSNYVDATGESGKDAAMEASNWLRTAQMNLEIGPAMKKHFAVGVVSSLNPVDMQKIGDLTRQKASQLLAEANIGGKKIYNENDFTRPALQYVLDHANWDQEGRGRWEMDLTSSELKAGMDYTESLSGTAGKDYANWWSIDALNLTEYPDGHPLQGYFTDDPFRKPGDIGVINKNQFELLPAHFQHELNVDMLKIVKAIRNESPNMSIADGRAQFMTAVINNNSIHGGDDQLGGADQNIPSKYTLPNPAVWYIEPSQIVKNGKRLTPAKLMEGYNMAWDGFRGKWFRYLENNQMQLIGIDELKQQGFTAPVSKQVVIR